MGKKSGIFVFEAFSLRGEWGSTSNDLFQPFPTKDFPETSPTQGHWAAKGLKLSSHYGTKVSVAKQNPDYSISQTPGSLTIHLDSDVVLLPIQVFRVVSTVPGTFVNNLTKAHDAIAADLIWDNVVRIKNSSKTSFEGYLKSHSFNFHSFSVSPRPDEVFSKIGVQWRLVNYQELLVNDNARVFPNSDKDCDCSNLAALAPGKAAQANVDAVLKHPNYIPGIPTILAMASLTYPTCCLEPIIGVTLKSRIVIVSAGDLPTINHELGHILGQGEFLGKCASNNTIQNNLMCVANTGLEITPEQAKSMKGFAKALREEWIKNAQTSPFVPLQPAWNFLRRQVNRGSSCSGTEGKYGAQSFENICSLSRRLQLHHKRLVFACISRF
jgi:hypothetical protein